MASASVRLFVYGSLKRFGRHHDVLQAASAQLLREAETAPGYRLETLGEYLALVPVAHPAEADVVQGELYELPKSQLAALDAFEGDAYTRGVVKLRHEAVAESLAYFKRSR